MQGRPKEFNREQALYAATDLFWRKGFEAASMTELLNQMGISRQSLYDTFGDKHALFMAALEQYFANVGEKISKVLTDGPSPINRVKRFLRAIGEKACTSDGRGCLLTNAAVELAPHDPAVRALVSKAFHLLETQLAKTLAQAAEAGELSPDTNVHSLARLLLTVMQGSIVLSKSNLAGHANDALMLLESMLEKR